MSAETVPGASQSSKAVVVVSAALKDVAMVELPMEMDVGVDVLAVLLRQSVAAAASAGRSVSVLAAPLSPPKSNNQR